MAAQQSGQRFEFSVAGAGNRLAVAAVIDKSVDRVLQHTLFVAYYDVGRTYFYQALKTIVTRYYAGGKDR